MQTFTRDVIDEHCPGVEWPDFLGRVTPGEHFVVETGASTGSTGPLLLSRSGPVRPLRSTSRRSISSHPLSRPMAVRFSREWVLRCVDVP